MTILTQSFTVAPAYVEPEILDDTSSFEAVYLDPTRVQFRYAGENLTLTLDDGSYYPRVSLRRCFPFSKRGMYVTVKIPDTEKERGKEIGIVNGAEQMDAESLAALSNELKLHYFVPVIKKINKIKEEYGFMYWTVLTDRGEKDFVMRDNVITTARQISPTRWLLIDINQARYEINDDAGLDAKSRALMVKHLLL